MTVSSHVFGKVLLSGEHAVVYGKPALAASINKGLIVTVSTKMTDKIADGLVRKAVEVAGGNPRQLDISISSDLPIGSGLGSSAAVAAGIIKAVRLYLNEPIELDELFALTLECERIAHGNPSGVDPAAVVYGGLIWFVKGQSIERFAVRKQYEFLLLNSGKPKESTKEMVEMVAGKERSLIDQIGGVTQKLREVLEKGEDITDLVNENGILLERLGVSGQGARQTSDELRSMGCGVKVTGAGGIQAGSGMLLVYHTDLSQVEGLLKQKKLDYFRLSIGG